jgi:hypothetical protein
VVVVVERPREVTCLVSQVQFSFGEESGGFVW